MKTVPLITARIKTTTNLRAASKVIAVAVDVGDGDGTTRGTSSKGSDNIHPSPPKDRRTKAGR
jgi:hypothetical protein